MAIDVKDRPGTKAPDGYDPFGEIESADATEAKRETPAEEPKKARKEKQEPPKFAFTAKRKAFLEGVTTAAKAVSTRSSLPILSHVLITAFDDGTVRLSANDLEIGIELAVPVDVAKPGAAAVPARPLIEVLSGLQGDEVTLTMTEKGRVKIKSEASDYKLFTLPAEEFPQLVAVESTAAFKVPGRALRRGLKRTLICVSSDESRPVMTGVLFAGKDGIVALAATDSHRLSLIKLGVSDDSGEVNSILPARALAEVMRLSPDSDEELVEVTMDAKSAEFVFENTVVATRVIEGNFPRFQQVIPQSFERTIEIPTLQLVHSLKRAEIVARDNSNVLRFETGEGVLIITAESTSVGDAYEEVDMALIGEPTKMGFNGRYLLEMLSALDSEITVIDANGEEQPVKITDGQDDSFLHILMPVQLQG